MRIPTRVTVVTPAPLRGSERASAQTTANCSPGAASTGTTIVTVATCTEFESTESVPGAIEVQLDRSFAVWPSAPRNAPSLIEAAPEYSCTGIAELVLFATSIRR